VKSVFTIPFLKQKIFHNINGMTQRNKLKIFFKLFVKSLSKSLIKAVLPKY